MMVSPFFKKAVIGALSLVAATLAIIHYGLTTYAVKQTGAPVPRDIQLWIQGAAFAAFFVAAVAWLINFRVLQTRLARVKQATEDLLDTAAAGGFGPDSDDFAALERAIHAVSAEHRKLVERLRLEYARRETILSNMAEGVLAVDHEERAIFCNRALLQALHFRSTRFEGASLLEIVRDPALVALTRSILAGGQAGKVRLRLSSESPRNYEVEVTPFATASGRGAIALFHDTTDLERLEQVRKDFVANVSHELRTPLTGIIGYADTLLDGALEDEKNRRRFIEIIRANAVRLGSITADLLVLSDLESGLEPSEPDAVSVPEVIEGVLVTVENEAREREVSLIRDGVADVSVAGSRLRLEQAILNLVANAIKFNKAGGEVRVRVATTDSGQVEIVIADTGVGIPSADLPRIFERFYRVDKARSRQVGGTGLGLSIVKHVVERMNGVISVESQFGKGTTFIIRLPQARIAG
ncbi:MAG: ATP-binding protein [Bryobacteraceae bacterium]